jgi:hypothetical protein
MPHKGSESSSYKRFTGQQYAAAFHILEQRQVYRFWPWLDLALTSFESQKSTGTYAIPTKLPNSQWNKAYIGAANQFGTVPLKCIRLYFDFL